MQLENKSLRMLAKGIGVPLWKIAERLKMSESTLIRKWRTPLTTDETRKIRILIIEISKSEGSD